MRAPSHRWRFLAGWRSAPPWGPGSRTASWATPGARNRRGPGGAARHRDPAGRRGAGRAAPSGRATRSGARSAPGRRAPRRCAGAARAGHAARGLLRSGRHRRAGGPAPAGAGGEAALRPRPADRHRGADEPRGAGRSQGRDRGGAAPGRRLSVAGPSGAEGGPAGVLEIETAALPPPPATSWWSFLLAVVAPVAAFGLLALVLGDRGAGLAPGAARGGLPGAVDAARSSGSPRPGWPTTGGRERARGGGAGRASRWRGSGPWPPRQGLPAEVAATSAAWDADAFRRPRRRSRPTAPLSQERLAESVEEAVRHLRRSLAAGAVLGRGAPPPRRAGRVPPAGADAVRNRQAYLYIAPGHRRDARAGLLPLQLRHRPLLHRLEHLQHATSPSPSSGSVFRNYADILGDFAFAEADRGRLRLQLPELLLDAPLQRLLDGDQRRHRRHLGAHPGADPEHQGAGLPARLPGAPHPPLGDAELHHGAHLEGDVPPAVRGHEPGAPGRRPRAGVLVRPPVHLLPDGATRPTPGSASPS